LALAYLNETIPLPRVTAIEVERRKLADAGETADGTYREDIAAVKMGYRIEMQFLTYDEYKVIVDYLDSIMWGETPFWMDEFGGTPATHSKVAVVDPGDEERVAFGRDGQWHNNGRHLSLTVKLK
jgi:hypothetical protein